MGNFKIINSLSCYRSISIFSLISSQFLEFVSLRNYPFYLASPPCWYTVIHGVFLESFILKFSGDVSFSLLISVSWLFSLFFLISLTESLSVVDIFEEPAFGFIAFALLFFCSRFHLFPCNCVLSL